jgi:5-methylthioribose kinase
VSTPAAALLDEATVIEHLRRRGILGDAEPATARQLGGGISNTVLMVEAPSRRLVVKQALPQLRVEREWLADPTRTVTEGLALQVAAGIDAASVPAVIDLDESRLVLAIAAAPPGTPDWKRRLLDGAVPEAEVQVARGIGAILGRLHAGTAHDAALHAQFDRWNAFEQLRVAPYFRSMVEDDPALTRVVMPHVEAMARRRVCLVHGDVSPKNVLVGDGLLWLIDFEVACSGDPAFDIAFMLCHLCMKAVHRPEHASTLHNAAHAFVAAYADHAAALLDDERHVAGLLGCLLMARVDGRSPAEYLTEDTRPIVRVLGLRLAGAPPRSLDAALRIAMEATR